MKEKAIIELKTERDIRLFLWLNKDDAATLNFQTISLVRNYNANQMYGGDINVTTHAINEAFFEMYNPDILNSYMFRMKRKKSVFYLQGNLAGSKSVRKVAISPGHS